MIIDRLSWQPEDIVNPSTHSYFKRGDTQNHCLKLSRVNTMTDVFYLMHTIAFFGTKCFRGHVGLLIKL